MLATKARISCVDIVIAHLPGERSKGAYRNCPAMMAQADRRHSPGFGYIIVAAVAKRYA
jgi:hypothetical protein